VGDDLMTRWWFDCDTGFDDLMALVSLVRIPDVELIGISTVVGNTTLANTTANTLATVEAFNIRVPVYRGAAKPLAQEPQTIEGLLGGGGMGTSGRRLPPAMTRVVERQPAAAAIAEALAQTAEPVSMLATGPLTNLATVLSTCPDLGSQIARLVVMGGSATSGNHTAAAEFNAFADPEAWDVIIRSGVPLEMFGLNLTRQVLITPEHEARIRAVGTELAQIIGDHLNRYLQIRNPGHPEPMALHDPSTVAYLAHPEWFELADAHVEVELHGTHTRGETVCELRVPKKAQPNARVAMTAQGDRVADYIVSAMQDALREVG
jgi:inosine-uridine nucleoside N-ribohydrolase